MPNGIISPYSFILHDIIRERGQQSSSDINPHHINLLFLGNRIQFLNRSFGLIDQLQGMKVADLVVYCG